MAGVLKGKVRQSIELGSGTHRGKENNPKIGG